MSMCWEEEDACSIGRWHATCRKIFYTWLATRGYGIFIHLMSSWPISNYDLGPSWHWNLLSMNVDSCERGTMKIIDLWCSWGITRTKALLGCDKIDGCWLLNVDNWFRRLFACYGAQLCCTPWQSLKWLLWPLPGCSVGLWERGATEMIALASMNHSSSLGWLITVVESETHPASCAGWWLPWSWENHVIRQLEASVGYQLASLRESTIAW